MGTTNKTGSQTVPGWEDVDNVFCVRQRVDITALATGEVVQCISIPAGTYVMQVMTKVITAEASGVCTATVGDGDGANSWDASVNFAATAGTITCSAPETDTYATTGKLYSTADTIDVTLTIASGPATSGVFDIMALCMKF